MLTGLVQGQESSGAKTIRKKPRGVIFCVSDGMSQGVLSMTEAFSNQLRGKGTSWWELLAGGEAVLGLMDTASSSSMVTDSAAASSAWSSGKRVPNGQINFDGASQARLSFYGKYYPCYAGGFCVLSPQEGTRRCDRYSVSKSGRRDLRRRLQVF